MEEQIKPVAISQKEIDLAHEGMELHETDAPEYIISAALLRACETVQQLQDELANSEYAATAEANAGDRARKQVKQLQRENAELKQAKLGTDLLNAELVGDLASAKWRLAEAEKDAERYRWLSERMQITNRTALNGTTRPALSMRVFCSFLDSTEIVKKTEGERVAFDAAIDAARTAHTVENQNG